MCLSPQGTICNDCVYACFCGPCSWCQIAREIETRMNPLIFINTTAWWQQRYTLIITSSLLPLPPPSSWTLCLLFTSMSAFIPFGIREGYFHWLVIKHVCLLGMSLCVVSINDTTLTELGFFLLMTTTVTADVLIIIPVFFLLLPLPTFLFYKSLCVIYCLALVVVALL